VSDTEEWSAISDGFVLMDHRYPDPNSWRVHMSIQEATTYALARYEQGGDKLGSRTLSHARRASENFYWIVFPQQGMYTFEASGQRTRVAPGSALVLSLDRMWRLRMPDSTIYTIRVPRAEIDHRLSPAGPRRALLDTRSGLGRVVQAMIHQTHTERSNLTAGEFNAVCDRICELLCLMSAGEMSPQRFHLAETAQAIRRFVRNNVGVADVRLPAAAQALAWSPRQLRVALHETGTTYREVRRDEALRAARDMLSNTETQHMSISEVAARCGFTATAFSTAFKARYGEPPREFRKRRLAQTILGDEPD
jgi:AraC-like DNA-binding protein